MSIQQLSVFLENRAGRLYAITRALAEEQVDLRAIHIAETVDYGVARLIVSDARRAAYALSEKNFVLSVTPVLAVAVPDRPGGLASVLAVLEEANVDLEYMYSLFGERNGRAYMILRVPEPDAVAALLTERGFAPAEPNELGLT